MSSSRLFLGELRSRRARFCFTGRAQNAIKWSCRSRTLQRTANRVLTVCLSQGGNPKEVPQYSGYQWEAKKTEGRFTLGFTMEATESRTIAILAEKPSVAQDIAR